LRSSVSYAAQPKNFSQFFSTQFQMTWTTICNLNWFRNGWCHVSSTYFKNEHSASIKHNQLAGLADRSSCQLLNCNDDNEYDLATEEEHAVLYRVLFWLNWFLGLCHVVVVVVVVVVLVVAAVVVHGSCWSHWSHRHCWFYLLVSLLIQCMKNAVNTLDPYTQKMQ
jgi:hypothetical protein